jgi:Fe-S cluster assembly iron-binding protein IscA
VGEIYTEVLYTKEEEQEIFKFIQTAKKSEHGEEESFFSKYVSTL